MAAVWTAILTAAVFLAGCGMTGGESETPVEAAAVRYQDGMEIERISLQTDGTLLERKQISVSDIEPGDQVYAYGNWTENGEFLADRMIIVTIG